MYAQVGETFVQHWHLAQRQADTEDSGAAQCGRRQTQQRARGSQIVHILWRCLRQQATADGQHSAANAAGDNHRRLGTLLLQRTKRTLQQGTNKQIKGRLHGAKNCQPYHAQHPAHAGQGGKVHCSAYTGCQQKQPGQEQPLCPAGQRAAGEQTAKQFAKKQGTEEPKYIKSAPDQSGNAVQCQRFVAAVAGNTGHRAAQQINGAE